MEHRILKVLFDDGVPITRKSDGKVFQLQGIEIFRVEFSVPHLTTLEPMAGVRIMRNWGMIPRNQG